MMSELPRISAGGAADVVGIGYQGFRSYLKRGLLGRVGMLPGFHRAGAHTSDDPTPRSGWMMFGFADLCLMRIAKLLMDNGFTFESASSVVSNHKLWHRMAHDDEPVDRFLLIWPPYGDHIIFDPEDMQHFPARIAEAQAQGVFTLLNLGDIQRYVLEAMATKSGAEAALATK
ncbi:hypothetical protein [Asticcacaulis solisilvae]|nr:hypothetical protein [Asticcacaulis solisilvae]MDR6800133.1 hypothetical protein [Asticcacaulis sp. BE141]